MRRFLWAQMVIHSVLLVAWTALAWPTLTVWKQSIPWLQFMSVFTIIESAAAGVAAAFAALESDKANHTTQES